MCLEKNIISLIAANGLMTKPSSSPEPEQTDTKAQIYHTGL